MAAIVKTLPVHSEFDKLAAFMRERLAAREAREGPRSPLAKLFSFGKGSSRGAEAPEGGKLVVTKDDLEAFEHAHPEVCFAIWMYQPPVMRMCFVSRTFMLTGWHRIELEDGVDPTDEQRLEYYAIMNRMINRGCNDTLHAERTLYANAFRAGNSLLSGFVIESGVMEHRWTSVAWTGAIPPLPEHPDIAEFEGFDANAEDFRDTTVFYTTGGLLTTRQQQAVPSEGTASDGGQFKSLALRSLGCFRYNQHKMTMVRLCDGRVLNQNVASCNFYGVLTDRQDLNFLNEFIFNDFLDGRDKLKAQFMELVLKRRNTMKIRHRQCKDLVKNLGGSAVSSVLEDGNACPDGFVWHETLIVAGNDPMANVWDPDREVDSDDKFAQGVETPRVSGFTPDHLRQQHLPRERCAYILQSDITEIRKLQERVYKAHKKELERKKQQKAAMRELLYSMMPRPVAQELLHASRKEAAAMAGADSPHGMGGSSSGRSLAASDEPLSGFRKMAGRIAPRQHDTVTICFTDIKGYTSMSKAADPIQVMTFLDELFGKFDEIVDVINAEFGDIGILYKVETIGDAFMVAGGLNLCMDADHKVKEGGGSSSSSSSSDEEGGSNDLDELLGRSQSGEPKLKTVASTILRMKQEGWMEQQVVGNDPVPGEGRPAPRDNRAIDEGPPLAQATAEDAALAVTYFAEQAIRVASETIMPDGKPACIRAGIHSGQVVSGIVGKKMPRFCLFGDSVNTASRMESNGKPGHIHISEPTWKLLQGQENGYSWLPTGGVELKGKGVQPTWLSERAYQANCGC